MSSTPDLPHLRALVQEHGWRGASARTGIPRTTLHRWLEQGYIPAEREREAVEFEQETEAPPGWEARLFAAMPDWERLNREGSTEADRADITIRSDRPIGIACTSDWHLGNAGTRHALVKSVVDGILATPFMFAVCNGDLVDNFVAHSHETGRYEQLLRPRAQKQLAAYIMGLLAPRLLCVTGGQHEFFEERVSDFDSAEYFARKGGAVYLGAGGVLNLAVGRQSYRLGVWHRYRGNSIYDATAAAKRCFREHGPFDVTVTADKHTPAVSYCEEQGVHAVFVQSGTAKLEDRYAKSLGYSGNPGGRIGTPVVILWPGERRFWVTTDFEAGCEYLRYLRGD